MNITKHCLARMQQRSITKDELDIVMAFGDISGDKFEISRKLANELIDQYAVYLEDNRGV